MRARAHRRSACAVLAAGEDQRGHSRQPQPGRRGPRRHPASSRRSPPGCWRARRGVERVEVARGQRVQRAERFREARRRRRAALPREQRLLAGGRQEQRVPSSVRGDLGCRAGPDRHVRDRPSAIRLQAQQRIGIAAQRRANRRRQQRAQRRVEVAGLQEAEHFELAQGYRMALPGPSKTEPLSRCLRSRASSARGPRADRGDAAQAPFGAQLADRRDRCKRGRSNGSGPASARPSRAPALRRAAG